MRKTKIVCTMGPREGDKAILAEIAKTMDVARFNFSHGTHESQLEMLKSVRAAAEKVDRPIATLLDTKGPEIRTGLIGGTGAVELVKDSTVVISPIKKDELTTSDHVYVTYDGIGKDLKEGNTVLIDDGALELRVDKISGANVTCKVIVGGILKERKGVNLPGVKVGLPGITDRDIADIKFGLENDFDYIAASFVRDAETINTIRGLIAEAGSNMKIIAKIESGEGIENLEEIIEASDGVMVARGDLGVEVEAKMIPQLQREMINKCNKKGKLVITATQMLDSMIRNPRPTRAEVTDVANAVYNGTDAVMLSGETASGDYPVEAVEMMASIVEYTEQFVKTGFDLKHGFIRGGEPAHIASEACEEEEAIIKRRIARTTCLAGITAAEELDAKAIIAPTTSGSTALQLSKCRPASDIYAFSHHPQVVRQMMLFRGVYPIQAERASSTDEILEDCMEILNEKKLAEAGDILVFTAGIVSGKRNSQRSETNMMRIITL